MKVKKKFDDNLKKRLSAIAGRIKSVREKNNLSQEDFANRIRVSRPTVSKIELGENLPTIDTILEISDTFDVSPEWLLNGRLSQDAFDLSVFGHNAPAVREMLEIMLTDTALTHATLGYFWEQVVNRGINTKKSKKKAVR